MNDAFYPQRNYLSDRKLLTLLVVLYPILTRYKAPVPFITLAEFFAIILVSLSIFRSGKIVLEKDINTVLVILYVLFSVIYAFIISPDAIRYDAVGTAARLLFLYIFLFFSYSTFDKNYGEKILIKVSFIVAVYELLQVFFARIGIYLTTYIPFLPIMAEDRDAFILSQTKYNIIYRPYSVLNEPAALSCYLLLPLVICIFNEDKKSKNFLWSIFFTVCIVLTMSSTGIICGGFLWFLFFIKKLRQRKISFTFFVRMLILITLLIIFLFKSGIFEYFLKRTFQNDVSVSGLSNSTRFYAIDKAFESKPIVEIFFGSTLALTRSYFAGWFRIYYCLGIMGLLFYIPLVINIPTGCYKKHRRLSEYSTLKTVPTDLKELRLSTQPDFNSSDYSYNKILKILFILLNVGTEIILGPFALMYILFARQQRI